MLPYEGPSADSLYFLFDIIDFMKIDEYELFRVVKS